MKHSRNLFKNLTAMVLSGITVMTLGNTAFAREMSLQESVLEALNNNHTIKQEESDVEKAKAVLGEAQGNQGVKLTWTGTVNKLGGHYYNSNNIDHSYGNTVTASLPLYAGGQLDDNLKSAKLGVDVSNYTLENTKQSIQLQVIQSYYQILNSQNIKDVRQNVVKQYSDHEQMAEAKYNAGVVPKSDLLRSQVNLADAQQNLTSAENDLQIAISDFNKLIGQDLMTDVQPSDDYLTNYKFTQTLQECMDEAVTNRPDGIATRKAVEQAQLAISAAKAGYLPQVSLVAQKDIAGNNMMTNDQSDKSAVGVQASWDLFDSNVTHSQVKQAEAALIRAQQEQADMDDQIRLDVRQAYLSMEAAQKNIHTTQVAVAQATEDNRIAQVRYQAGVGTNSDILDTISDYVTARMNYNQALYDYTVSIASLNKAMGLDAQSIINDLGGKGSVVPTVSGTVSAPAANETAVAPAPSEKASAPAVQEENDSTELNVLDRGSAQADN